MLVSGLATTQGPRGIQNGSIDVGSYFKVQGEFF